MVLKKLPCGKFPFAILLCLDLYPVAHRETNKISNQLVLEYVRRRFQLKNKKQSVIIILALCI